jgi:hypothetical protein
MENKELISDKQILIKVTDNKLDDHFVFGRVSLNARKWSSISGNYKRFFIITLIQSDNLWRINKKVGTYWLQDDNFSFMPEKELVSTKELDDAQEIARVIIKSKSLCI